MTIALKKFGTTLLSRQAGREAYAALQPFLKGVKDIESIEVDFDGVLTFSPSWGDEFLTPLCNAYEGRFVLKHTNNPSVRATLEILETNSKNKFSVLN